MPAEASARIIGAEASVRGCKNNGMTERRVTTPVFAPGQQVKGPPSYFPSIEKTYGKPIQHWLDIAAEQLESGKPHMEVVGILKSEHALGHGHANAIVGYTKAQLAR